MMAADRLRAAAPWVLLHVPPVRLLVSRGLIHRERLRPLSDLQAFHLLVLWPRSPRTLNALANPADLLRFPRRRLDTVGMEPSAGPAVVGEGHRAIVDAASGAVVRKANGPRAARLQRGEVLRTHQFKAL